MGFSNAFWNKEFERKINTISEGKGQDIKKLKVIDHWYKFDGWEKIGKETSLENNVEKEGEIFDFWNGAEWKEFWKKVGKIDSLGKLAGYFGFCENSKVKVLGVSEETGYYFNKRQGEMWANKFGIDWSKNRGVNLGLVKPTSEINFEELIKTGEAGFCKDQIGKSEEINGGWQWRRLKSYKEKKGIVVYAVLNKNKSNSHIQLQKLSKNENNREWSIVPVKDFLYEKDKVKPHVGKIRVIEITNDSGLIYVDEWFEEIVNEDLINLKKHIENIEKCSIEEEENSNKCHGIWVKSEVKDGGDLKKELRNMEVYMNGGVYEGGWKRLGEGNYSEDLSKNWEWFGSDLSKEYLKWRREIGIVWKNKVFKWRSF
ncbi:hypothetical protein [Mycoplasma parvum]|uniref:Uncharacterized protein n=1 Tax=Mycoplasma parvum str. Indiana TaxID=1403316 RepID=U5NFK6_9MOLU|nr:hypothetical protein [Mycoplasma parvum]AGX88934.1 hypothetical protein PRV_00845 [Mycoplasma parvum str. Indiana]